MSVEDVLTDGTYEISDGLRHVKNDKLCKYQYKYVTRACFTERKDGKTRNRIYDVERPSSFFSSSFFFLIFSSLCLTSSD